MIDKTWRLVALPLAATAVLPSVDAAVAQGIDRTAYSQAEGVAVQAEDLSAAGAWRAAEVLLMVQSEACEGVIGGRECRLLMSYALGYLYDRWSSEDPANRTAHLETAGSYYRSVLNEEPDHIATLNSLALVNRQLGTEAFSAAFLNEAIAAQPERAGWYHVLHGDVLRDARDFSSAESSYRRAVDASPTDPIPRLRLARIYRELAADRVSELFERAADWEAPFPDAALEAYTSILWRLSDVEEPRLTFDALTRLVSLVARRGSITGQSLDVLPPQLQASRPVSDLRTYIAAPTSSPSTDNWWVQAQTLNATLAEVGLALGRQMSLSGEIADAERTWQVGLDFVPLDHPTGLELRRELVSLYHRVPQLDPDGTEFSAIVAQLFGGKTGSIQSGDLAAQERFHTTLGLIYAERETWNEPSGGFQNARFQLFWAVQTAEQRSAIDRVYRPVPQLKALLAQAYMESDEPSAAAEAYGDAVEQLLDTDQLDDAAEMLRRTPASSGAEARLQALRALTQTRINLSRSVLAGDIDDGFCTSFSGSVLPESSVPDVSPEFLDRQRFKVHSDCAFLTTDEVRQYHAARAINLAATESVNLVGVADLLRVERVNANLRESLGLPPDPSHLDASQEARIHREGSAFVTLPTTGGTFVALPELTLVGSYLVEREGLLDAPLRMQFLSDSLDLMHLMKRGESILTVDLNEIRVDMDAIRRRIRR